MQISNARSPELLYPTRPVLCFNYHRQTKKEKKAKLVECTLSGTALIPEC